MAGTSQISRSEAGGTGRIRPVTGAADAAAIDPVSKA